MAGKPQHLGPTPSLVGVGFFAAVIARDDFSHIGSQAGAWGEEM